MSNVRLIERWLPIAALGEESARERRSMTALPAPYYLHVWWARRPLIASRAAILASVLPAQADRDRFMQILGIHGDPIASRRRINQAKRSGVRFEGEAYGYNRAFSYCPTPADQDWLKEQAGQKRTALIDPTAGGGSIPLEAYRLGLETYANDLNPVAAAVLMATVFLPAKYGESLRAAYDDVATTFLARREALLRPFYPPEPDPNAVPTNFLWARTITCPYCSGREPISPNWRLSPSGTGIRLEPHLHSGPGAKGRCCDFSIVSREEQQSPGTVFGGDATCCFPDCRRVIDAAEVKRQAQSGEMGEQLFAIVFKHRTKKVTKSGRKRDTWERGYRAAITTDDNSDAVKAALAEKIPQWEADDSIPNEEIELAHPKFDPAPWGVTRWRQFFTPRQLLAHGLSVQVFREMVEADRLAGKLSDLRKAAYFYLAISLDKVIDYNSKVSAWHSGREVMEHTFREHEPDTFCPPTVGYANSACHGDM